MVRLTCQVAACISFFGQDIKLLGLHARLPGCSADAGSFPCTRSVSTGIGACMAAWVYEVGRPARLSTSEAVALEGQWQDFGMLSCKPFPFALLSYGCMHATSGILGALCHPCKIVIEHTGFFLYPPATCWSLQRSTVCGDAAAAQRALP